MSLQTSITEDMLTAFDGLVPSPFSSASAAGVPNVTYISQVFYVDPQHVALSRQFFNKSVQNITENPFACVIATCPITPATYKFKLQFIESQTEGVVFDNMKLQLEVIAGMQGQSHLFNLLGADIYKVLSIERVYVIPE